jgi:hypothetical protein
MRRALTNKDWEMEKEIKLSYIYQECVIFGQESGMGSNVL